MIFFILVKFKSLKIKIPTLLNQNLIKAYWPITLFTKCRSFLPLSLQDPFVLVTVNSVDPNGTFVQFKYTVVGKRFPNIGVTWRNLAVFHT